MDPETVELAKARVPQILRSRGRAVTAADYEALARLADPRVQRARCVQPVSGNGDSFLAGRVYLLLVPKVNRAETYIAPDQLDVEDDLRDAVRRYLDRYRLLTVRLDIREPEYAWIAVDVTVVSSVDSDPERVRADAERRLYQFLNPIVGGTRGDGWPFSRDLYPSDVYTCLQSVRGVEYVESLHLYQVYESASQREITDRLELTSHGVVASAEHHVNVRLRERGDDL
jgi:predicted phage baseplate assembly protein